MKFLICVFSLLSLFGCATPRPTFKREYTAVNSKDFKYEDKNILFTYTPISYGSSIPISIQNKSDKAIKIIWDESTFINQLGQSERILHEGVKLADRNTSMPPSVLPPLGKIEDSITPTSKIDWIGNNWSYSMICGDENHKGDLLNEMYQTVGLYQEDEHCLNQTFGLFLTYEIDGKKSTFTSKYRLSKRQINK